VTQFQVLGGLAVGVVIHEDFELRCVTVTEALLQLGLIDGICKDGAGKFLDLDSRLVRRTWFATTDLSMSCLESHYSPTTLVLA